MIRPIAFEDPELVILDQSLLPGQVVYERCPTAESVAEAICRLKVRGAPLIGVCAAYGVALAMKQYSGPSAGLLDYFYQVKNLLAATRPTAVNLFWALQRMERVVIQNQKQGSRDLARILVDEANRMYREDIETNRAIGEQGQSLLSPASRVMTICNAGALATCGYGTALGVIRSAAQQGKIEMVWACETRPVLQGSRLTVWELMQDQIPVTLITDNMAAHIMSLGKVDAVIVGADRVSANGDTANKIGTYSLAILARYHNLPFYVAAPRSTIDLEIAGGEGIPIEERHDDEVKYIQGHCLSVPEAKVYNPAFDVTPHQLITGIITEKGIVKPPYAGQFISLLKEDE
ncbi:MAG TPA: S-methyl-5-thioribose-1-phosphate isomerase [Syntrophomonadaceae bacterium]|nr:S-methyl-5-thioribose-1-phosphate isomerase [Syntrophomonadaceae bacterium]